VLDALESIFDLFSDDKEKKCTRKLLEARIENLFSQLQRIAESDRGRQ